MFALRGIALRILPVLLLTLAVAAPAQAAPVQSTPEAAQQLRQAEADVRAIDRQAGSETGDEARVLLHGRLATAAQSANAVAEQLAGRLEAIDARIAELGAAGAAEAPEVRRQRAALAAERLSLDAAIKRAKLLDVEADQLRNEMQKQEAQQFGARMSRRTASPFGPGLWGAVIGSFDADAARIGTFLSDGERQARAEGTKRGIFFALLGIVLAAAIVWPGRRVALRLGRRYLISDAPDHEVRRTVYALWLVLVGTIGPLLGAVALVAGANLSNLPPPNWNGLLLAFIGTTGFAAYTAAVFGALLMRSQPAWRVAPIPDVVAERLRPLSWILAGITFVTGLIEAFNEAVGASEAALAATKVMEAGGSVLLIGGALLALGRIRAAEADARETAAAGAGVSALSLVLWIVLLVSFVALAIGFVEFSGFLLNMIVWASVVCVSAYLLMAAVDAVATGVFSRHSRLGRSMVRGVGVRGGAIDQFGVLLSGAIRLALGLIAFVMLLAPFGAGTGVTSTLEKIAAVTEGIQIGGVAVSPGAILRGIVVLVIGLALVRWFMAWLEKRYLPATDLDGSGRNSVSLIARYIGIALAAIWSLASLGIGVEKIALLLSALSVGIGFGLQAITQNFISGLILLAERPIKIGDLIKVGNEEGDVRRISVRSTELELGDHSTLIIPNSELITKPVLNKTLASPLGRVQIQFSVPIEADAAAVERILLEAFGEDEAILTAPAPSVFIDSIADGRIAFNSFAHVDGPRSAYGARSRVLKALMRRLREEGIVIGSAPQRLELVDGRDVDRAPQP
jgi:potassium efflux system protein